MAVHGKRVSVTDEPTLVSSVESALVINLDATDSVDVGGADVVTGAGFPLAAGAALPADLRGGESLYAVTASGTVELGVLETGV